MADETSSSTKANTVTSIATEATVPPETPMAQISTVWALPAGIEDDIEQAIVKTAVGALAGGVVGLFCFKGGKGTRAASIATGVGAGLGSTWERVKFRYAGQENK